MKKCFFSLVFCLFSFMAFSQVREVNITKINGIEIYIMCEPTQKYEVIVDSKAGIKGKSLITGGLVNNGIADEVENFVKKLQKEAEKEGKTIDAIIYSAGKSAIGIKFKEPEK